MMVFNPMYLHGNTESAQSAINTKINTKKNNYLFADIIKIYGGEDSIEPSSENNYKDGLLNNEITEKLIFEYEILTDENNEIGKALKNTIQSFFANIKISDEENSKDSNKEDKDVHITEEQLNILINNIISELSLNNSASQLDKESLVTDLKKELSNSNILSLKIENIENEIKINITSINNSGSNQINNNQKIISPEVFYKVEAHLNDNTKTIDHPIIEKTSVTQTGKIIPEAEMELTKDFKFSEESTKIVSSNNEKSSTVNSNIQSNTKNKNNTTKLSVVSINNEGSDKFDLSRIPSSQIIQNKENNNKKIILDPVLENNKVNNKKDNIINLEVLKSKNNSNSSLENNNVKHKSEDDSGKLATLKNTQLKNRELKLESVPKAELKPIGLKKSSNAIQDVISKINNSVSELSNSNERDVIKSLKIHGNMLDDKTKKIQNFETSVNSKNEKTKMNNNSQIYKGEKITGDANIKFKDKINEIDDLKIISKESVNLKTDKSNKILISKEQIQNKATKILVNKTVKKIVNLHREIKPDKQILNKVENENLVNTKPSELNSNIPEQKNIEIKTFDKSRTVKPAQNGTQKIIEKPDKITTTPDLKENLTNTEEVKSSNELVKNNEIKDIVNKSSNRTGKNESTEIKIENKEIKQAPETKNGSVEKAVTEEISNKGNGNKVEGIKLEKSEPSITKKSPTQIESSPSESLKSINSSSKNNEIKDNHNLKLDKQVSSENSKEKSVSVSENNSQSSSAGNYSEGNNKEDKGTFDKHHTKELFINTDKNIKNNSVFELKEKPVITHQQNAERIVKATELMKEVSNYIQKGNKGSMVLQLEPEHLGKVKIVIETIDKLLSARIEVENIAAKVMIEKNMNDLFSHLNKSGVQLSQLNVAMQDGDNRPERAFHQKKKVKDRFISDDNFEDESNNSEKNFGYNTYEYLA